MIFPECRSTDPKERMIQMNENTWNLDDDILSAGQNAADIGEPASHIEAEASQLAAAIIETQSEATELSEETVSIVLEAAPAAAPAAAPEAQFKMKDSVPVKAASEASENKGTGKGWHGKFKNILAGFLAGVVFTASVSAASIGGFLAVSRDGLPWNQGVQTAETAAAASDAQSPSNVTNSSGSRKAITAALGTGTLTIPEIAEKTKNSVVGISTETMYGTSTGTGIIYSADGTIITNAHVISGGRKITVTLADGTTYDAVITGSDTKSDLAVIRIKATGLLPATFGNSNNLVVGETAVAIGNPLGLEFAGSVTAGVISALNREVDVDGRYMTLVQTDAAINPGNSGGPLLNNKGEVVGINSVKVSTEDTEGLGFAIPISNALPIIQELIANGQVTGRPSIGISGEELSAQAASYYNVPQGFLVRTVTSGSGAEAGGLQAGDIIIAFNGVTVKTQSELNREKDRCAAGDTATIRVYRTTTSKEIDLKIVLSEAVG